MATSKQKLLSWTGDTKGIYVGDYYFIDLETSSFKDANDDVRISILGGWGPPVEVSSSPEIGQPVQPEPVTNPESQNVVPEVMKDMTERMIMGIKSYGVPLQTFNGRSPLQDLYEELLDAACYIKQAIMESERLTKPSNQ